MKHEKHYKITCIFLLIVIWMVFWITLLNKQYARFNNKYSLLGNPKDNNEDITVDKNKDSSENGIIYWKNRELLENKETKSLISKDIYNKIHIVQTYKPTIISTTLKILSDNELFQDYFNEVYVTDNQVHELDKLIKKAYKSLEKFSKKNETQSNSDSLDTQELYALFDFYSTTKHPVTQQQQRKRSSKRRKERDKYFFKTPKWKWGGVSDPLRHKD
ncbi:uncharacterized protein LOC142330524 isoform X2 [Lycorma delicatula]|uniref:uncharacterized protein LOC142330524 isoform X2 n=1 Tax=Lycorma delicatula TaxID=130591 RepID=UPI003F514E86